MIHISDSDNNSGVKRACLIYNRTGSKYVCSLQFFFSLCYLSRISEKTGLNRDSKSRVAMIGLLSTMDIEVMKSMDFVY